MEDCIIGKRELSPDAASVTVLPEHVLRERFVNGELRDFDMKPLLARKCYQPLHNGILFPRPPAWPIEPSNGPTASTSTPNGCMRTACRRNKTHGNHWGRFHLISSVEMRVRQNRPH